MMHNLPGTESIRPALMSMVGKGKTSAITSHQSPDGDGHAAALALQCFLLHGGFIADIVTDADDLSRFEFLGARGRVVSHAMGMHYDTVIVLDCNSLDRLGKREALITQAQAVAVIDHHVQEHHPIPAAFSFIEPAYVSAGAILYRALQDEMAAMPEEDRLFMANCFWITLLNDTNNFINANTDAHVFETAKDLMAYGIKPHILYKEFFQNHSANEMRFVGETLSTIRLYHNDKLLVMHSTLAMQEANGIDAEAIMSVTRWVQGTSGLIAIVYICEKKPGIWKLSLRSQTLNVQAIAAKYGGGGHMKASGCTIKGDLKGVEAQILQDFKAAITSNV
ncbi:MAG TPA: DHH family phosphoesterase [Candidatus Cloacimonadota bacterium]|nr:DHH family phosphoesterase [Candidatus Cloacimonadota bacterium]